MILSALWNLSAHCRKNKSEVCSNSGALQLLVQLLRSRYKDIQPSILLSLYISISLYLEFWCFTASSAITKIQVYRHPAIYLSFYLSISLYLESWCFKASSVISKPNPSPNYFLKLRERFSAQFPLKGRGTVPALYMETRRKFFIRLSMIS